MRLRSGIEFVPYYLKGTFRPRTPLENPISTLVNVETLIQDAVAPAGDETNNSLNRGDE